MSDYPSPYEASDQFDGWYNNQILANDEEGAAAALPPGWEEMRDSRSGRAYYVDHENQITTWDRPTNNVDSPDADVDNDVMDMGVPNAHGESSMQEESVQEETVHETVEGQTSNPNNNDDKVHPSNDWQSTTTTRMPPLDESHEQHQQQQPNDEEITEEEVVAYCPRVVVNSSDKWDKNFEGEFVSCYSFYHSILSNYLDQYMHTNQRQNVQISKLISNYTELLAYHKRRVLSVDG